jgi:hypothetical protein
LDKTLKKTVILVSAFDSELQVKKLDNLEKHFKIEEQLFLNKLRLIALSHLDEEASDIFMQNADKIKILRESLAHFDCVIQTYEERFQSMGVQFNWMMLRLYLLLKIEDFK